MYKRRNNILAIMTILMFVLGMVSITNADLVGHWRFDGNTNDSVGNNDGTIVNGAIVGTDNGIVGGAASFDGLDDAIYVSSSPITGTAWSLAWWDKNPGTGSEYGYMVASGDPYGYEILLASISSLERYYGGLMMGINNDSRFNVDGYSGPFPRGQWHHHVVTHDGAGTAKWYIDGGAEVMTAPNPSTFTAFDSRIYIANRKDLARPYAGLIDDLRLYDNALTPSEVTDVMNAYLANVPDPANNADGVDPAVELSWLSPGLVDNPTYDVYLSTDPNLFPSSRVAEAQSGTTYDPDPDLALTTQYYWRVDVNDPNDGTGNPITWLGQRWTFTTGGKVINPSPADGSFLATANPVELSWDPSVLATSYDVYFGTTPSVSFLGNVTEPNSSSLTLPVLNEFTTYYWRVDVKSGDTALMDGDVWSFSIGGLIGHWKFDGDPNDSVGSNHGTIVNAATVGTNNGLFGGAASFNATGATDAIYVPSSALTGTQWSLAFWDKNDDLGYDSGYMVASGDPVGYEILATALNDGPPKRYWGSVTQGIDGGTTFGFSGGFPRGQWHHHVVVNDGSGTARWYIDGGAQVLTDASSFTAFDSRIYLGNRKNLARPYTGLIDDLRFYSGALSAEEVESLFDNNPFASDPSPENGAVSVPVDTDLTWTAGLDAESHDVYLGTDLTLVTNATTEADEFMGNVTVETYTPPVPLDPLIPHYWRIDEKIGDHTVKGTVWTFTTGSACWPPLEADLTGDCVVNLADFAVMANEWMQCHLIPESECP